MRLDRHDHHNLEIKLELPHASEFSVIEQTFALFLPKSLQSSILDKKELASDFRSRLRISPLFSRMSPVEALAEALTEITADPTKLQRIGLLLDEAMKATQAQVKRETSRTSSSPLLLDRIQTLTSLNRQLRTHLASGKGLEADLDFYRSHLFLEFLCSLVEYRRPDLDQILQTEQEEEAAHRRTCSTRPQSPLFAVESLEGRELYLVRLAQLKKFFQSETFVEVTHKETLKRWSEPISVLMAGTAALVATLIREMSGDSWLHFGFQGLTIVFTGIALYVLTDRLKDRGKAYMTNQLTRFLPETEHHLYVKGIRAGSIAEWFSLERRRDLPRELQDRRLQHKVSCSEAHLSEDTWMLRRRFRLRAKGLAHLQPLVRNVIQENIRINLERHLKFMDDPYKTIPVPDENGSLARVQSHRVYHFHLFVRIKLIPKAGSRQTAQDNIAFYRIVMDKQGIDRVEILPAYDHETSLTFSDAVLQNQRA